MTAIPPGSTIGILGGGQLGRMIAAAAAQLGYRTHVLAPDRESVAAQTASSLTRADYHNKVVLADFAAQCDVVTYEFENIATGPVEWLAARVPVHPSPKSLAVAQDRIAEKQFVEQVGGRPARWQAVATRAELDAAIAAIGTPAVLKTTRFGYDGKGQTRLASPADADAAWEAIGGPAVLEAFVEFTHEFSIVLVRGADGTTTSYPPPWNEHRDGILHRSTLPAPAEIASQWTEAATLAGQNVHHLHALHAVHLQQRAARQDAADGGQVQGHQPAQIGLGQDDDGRSHAASTELAPSARNRPALRLAAARWSLDAETTRGVRSVNGSAGRPVPWSGGVFVKSRVSGSRCVDVGRQRLARDLDQTGEGLRVGHGDVGELLQACHC